MKLLRTIGWAAVLAVLAATAGFWAQRHLSNNTLINTPAPEIVLNDLEGKPHHLADWRGKLLLVNFWASWCAPCLDEMPLLVAAQTQYAARGLQVIGPAMDEVESVQRIAARFGINYPVMADYAQVDAAMKLLGNEYGGLPFSVLISRDGRVLETLLGGLREDQLQRLLEANL